MPKSLQLINERILNRLISIFQDSWGVLTLLVVSIYLKEEKTSNSIFDLFVPEKFIRILRQWIEPKNNTTNEVIKTAIFTILLSFLTSVILCISVFTLHLFFPKTSKIVSHISLPFIIYGFPGLFIDRKMLLIGVSVSTLLAIYGLIRTFHNFDTFAYEISRKLSGKLLRQKKGFYFKIILHWMLIITDVIILRVSVFSRSCMYKNVIFVLYIISFTYSSAFSLRSSLTAYHAKEILSTIEPIMLIDSVYFYFNSRCFAIWKAVSLVFSQIYFIHTNLFVGVSDQPSLFENSHSALYVGTLRRKSFVKYMLFSKDKVWYNDIRKKMMRINFTEDLLPSMIICWIILHSCIIVFQKNFIRFHESFVIIFTHFLILMEIFNSYIFISIYRVGQSTVSLKLKSASEHPKDSTAKQSVIISVIDAAE